MAEIGSGNPRIAPVPEGPIQRFLDAGSDPEAAPALEPSPRPSRSTVAVAVAVADAATVVAAAVGESSRPKQAASHLGLLADKVVGCRHKCLHAAAVLFFSLLFLGAGPERFAAVETELTTRRPELDRTLIQVMLGLGAEPAGCKAGMLTQPLVHALCGKAPAEMKRKGDDLRAEVGRLMEQVASARPFEDGWRIERAISQADFAVGEVKVTAVVKPKSAQVSLMYSPDATACLTPEARTGAVDSTLITPTEGFEPPLLEFRAQPDYPEEARIEPRSGQVLLGFRVEANGEVSEVCVAMSDDRGINFAFARSAAAAWKKNRYKPARLDDKPVASIASAVMSFWIEGRTPRP